MGSHSAVRSLELVMRPQIKNTEYPKESNQRLSAITPAGRRPTPRAVPQSSRYSLAARPLPMASFTLLETPRIIIDRAARSIRLGNARRVCILLTPFSRSHARRVPRSGARRSTNTVSEVLPVIPRRTRRSFGIVSAYEETREKRRSFRAI